MGVEGFSCLDTHQHVVRVNLRVFVKQTPSKNETKKTKKQKKNANEDDDDATT